MNGRQSRGVYVVEFAIVGTLFFVLLLGILEMGRLYFTVNALDEVVRRGARLAAVCDPILSSERDKVVRRAIFNAATDAGASSLIANLQTSNLVVAYFDKDGLPVTSPGNTTTASGFRAIRYVQVRVSNFPFKLSIPGLGGTITLPLFQATFPRESLGRHAEGIQPHDVQAGITPC